MLANNSHGGREQETQRNEFQQCRYYLPLLPKFLDDLITINTDDVLVELKLELDKNTGLFPVLPIPNEWKMANVTPNLKKGKSAMLVIIDP